MFEQPSDKYATAITYQDQVYACLRMYASMNVFVCISVTLTDLHETNTGSTQFFILKYLSIISRWLHLET